MLEYWTWFSKLNNRRPAGMGVSPIMYSEMKAFFELNNLNPDPYEIEVIEIFDRIALKAYSDQQEKRDNKEKANQPKQSGSRVPV